jgi:hypothetical protein
MQEHQHTKNGFPANEATAIYSCRHVLQEDKSVLFAVRDHDEWSFLCGEEHEVEDLAIACLGCLLAKDPTLEELAHMNHCEEASREPGEAWKIVDPNEEVILEHIKEYGWHAALVPESDDQPRFAYSIGLFQRYQQPELILFGLPHDLMHDMISDYEKMLAAKTPPSLNERIASLLEGYDCIFKEVLPKHLREYFGYGLWFYKGPFPAIQCIWPDKAGKFPWEDDCHPRLKIAQPLLYL